MKTEKYAQLRIIFGVVNDKDVTKIISLLPKNAVYYFTKASVMRALNETELQQTAEKAGLNGKSYPSVKNAIIAAKQDATSNDLIFIGGSTFIVADALPYFL